MIMARSGPYLARTGHDHDCRPKCLNVKPGPGGINGRYRLAADYGRSIAVRPPSGPARSRRPMRIPDQRGPVTGRTGILLLPNGPWFPALGPARAAAVVAAGPGPGRGPARAPPPRRGGGRR